MMDFSSCSIEIDFEVIDVNDLTMSMSISTADQSYQWDPLSPGKFTWASRLRLPTEISIRSSNRPPHSTLVDDNGNILRNMSVIIKDLRLDGMSCWRYWLDHNIILHPDDESVEPIIGRAICENGKIDIDFPEPNAFYWIAKSSLTND